MRRAAIILFILFTCLRVYPQGASTYMPTNLYMFNTLLVNPAYAGVKESFSFSAMYSKWWMGFDGNNDVQVITGHTPLKDSRMAVGFMLENNRFGRRNYTNAYGYYNYRIELGGGRLGMGLRAGGNYYLNNLANADLPTPVDGAFIDERFFIPNFGVGTFYYSDRMYAGLSVPTLMFPKSSSGGFKTSFMDYNFTFVGGVLLDVSDQFKIKPSTNVKFIPRTSFEGLEYNINTNFILFNDLIWLGGSYKSNKAIVGMLEVQITKQIRFGYAYEFPMGNLQTFSNGVHEFLLRYDFAYIVRAVNPGFFW